MDAPRYRYKCFNPFARPGAFNDSSRVEEYEVGNISYALLQPNPPYDDDSMLLRWDNKQKRWIMNFAMVVRGGKYPTGDIIGENIESDERAALVLLANFGLESRAEEFLPEEVGSMSPEYLHNLAYGHLDDD